MKIKKILSLCLLAGMLSGCEARPPAGGEFPVASREITLNVWMGNDSQGYVNSYNDMRVFEELRKRTGVRLNFIHPSGAIEEQLGTLLASSEYPDIIFAKWNKNGQMQLDSGIALRLNEYMEQDAPNLTRILQQHPQYRRQLELVNGDIIMFPKIVDDQRFLCYDGYFIREDWLEQTGKTVPTTIEAWYEVLKAFRDRDFNGNGLADEVPFSALDWSFEDAFLTAFDIPRYDYFKAPGEDRITHAVLAPRFREYLQTMHAWYQEGLINPNFSNTTAKELDALAADGRLGAFYGDNNNALPKYMRSNPDARFTAVPYPQSPSGARYYPRNDIKMMVRAEGAVITSTCSYPREAVRLLDYLYSPAGQDLMNWGLEGESYEKEKGVNRFTELILKNPQGKSPREAISHFMTNTGFAGVLQYAAAEALDSGLPAPVREIRRTSMAYAQEADKSLTPLPPKFTSEETGRITQKEADIDSYVNQMIKRFIIGMEPLENFDAFLSEVQRMGIGEIIAVYQQAYERQGFA